MHDNEIMGSILSFFAEHSPTIIKTLSVAVAVAASVLLYRVLFIQNSSASTESSSADLSDVNKKLNEQKIEIDTLKSENEASKSELEKQRTEVYNLRQTIKEKETEVESIKAENAQLKNQSSDSKIDYEKHKSEVILSTSDENLVFQKEIAELKRRLSDYEIIAEDISDMQRLKEENEKLKAQLEQAGGADTSSISKAGDEASPEVIATETSLETGGLSLESLAEVAAAMADQSPKPTEKNNEVVASAGNDTPAVETFRNPSADAPADFKPNETSSIETEVLGPGPGDDIENVDAILAEAAQKADPPANKKDQASPAVVVQAEIGDGVSEVDKSLLEKFEKQKES